MLGFIATPRGGNVVPYWVTWAADNGRFSAPEDYTDRKYLKWLERRNAATCLFATAPDVLADHAATVEMSRPLFPSLRKLGYMAAFVAQDGWSETTTPWDEFDVLFIGGTTRFKLSLGGEAIRAARCRNKHVHMGRVNSFRRLRLAAAAGCHSADGTFLKFGPDINQARLQRWLDRLTTQPVFEMFPPRKSENDPHQEGLHMSPEHGQHHDHRSAGHRQGRPQLPAARPRTRIHRGRK
jgi:hypothetical protein